MKIFSLIFFISLSTFCLGQKNIYLSSADSAALCVKAKVDAFQYYHGYKGARTTTLVLTLAGGMAGAIPAWICSSTAPNKNHLQYPDSNLIKNPLYFQCYRMQAKEIKSEKVWGTFGKIVGIEVGIGIAFTIFILSHERGK